MLGNKGSRKEYRSGGTRGGQDQFKWDDVKVDKYRLACHIFYQYFSFIVI